MWNLLLKKSLRRHVTGRCWRFVWRCSVQNPGYKGILCVRDSKPDLGQFRCCFIHQNSAEVFASSPTIHNGFAKLMRCYGRDSQTDTTQDGNLYEQENEWFHRVLSESPEYADYLLSDERTLIQETIDHADCMKKLKHGELPSDANTCLATLNCITVLPSKEQKDLVMTSYFKGFCFHFLGFLPLMNNAEFWQCLRILVKFDFMVHPFPDCENLVNVIRRTVDEQCVSRCSKWTRKEMFLAADFFYHYNYSARSRFVSDFMRSFTENVTHLGRSEIIWLLFHINLHRNTSPDLVSSLADVLCRKIETFSATELSFICLAFFKTKTAVRNYRLIDKLLPQLQQKVASMEDVALAAAMKFIRRSTHKRMVFVAPQTVKALVNLQPVLAPLLGQKQFSTAMHIVSVFENIKDISEELIQELCNKILNEDIQHWRLKDLAGSSKVIGNLVCESSNQHSIASLKRIEQELMSKSRDSEREQFQRSTYACLLGLSLGRIYPKELIKSVFSSVRFKNFGSHDMDFRRDLYHLSESVRIEVPEYTGPWLDYIPPHALQEYNINKVLRNDPERLNSRDAMLQSIVSSYYELLGGSSFVQVGTLLKHYQTPDIELRLTKSGQPIPVRKWTDIKSEKQVPNLMSSPVSEHNTQLRVAVILQGINSYFTLRDATGQGRKALIGYQVTKERQLRKLGYQVIRIPYFEFEKVKHVEDYLEKKTFKQTPEEKPALQAS